MAIESKQSVIVFVDNTVNKTCCTNVQNSVKREGGASLQSTVRQKGCTSGIWRTIGGSNPPTGRWGSTPTHPQWHWANSLCSGSSCLATCASNKGKERSHRATSPDCKGDAWGWPNPCHGAHPSWSVHGEVQHYPCAICTDLHASKLGILCGYGQTPMLSATWLWTRACWQSHSGGTRRKLLPWCQRMGPWVLSWSICSCAQPEPCLLPLPTTACSSI